MFLNEKNTSCHKRDLYPVEIRLITKLSFAVLGCENKKMYNGLNNIITALRLRYLIINIYVTF